MLILVQTYQQGHFSGRESKAVQHAIRAKRECITFCTGMPDAALESSRSRYIPDR